MRLHNAIVDGNLGIVRSLLANGANPDETYCEIILDDDYRVPILHIAVGSGNLEITKELLASGANPNSRNGYDNNSPLHLAAKDGNLRVAKELLAAGAWHSPRNYIGESPLDIASGNGYLEIAKELLAADNRRKKRYNLALYYATLTPVSNVPIIRELLVAGANANACIGNDSILSMVTGTAHIDNIRELLSAGAKICDKNPFIRAFERARSDIIEFLTQSGFNINCYDESVFKILYWEGIGRHHIRSVRKLLAAGAKIGNAFNTYKGNRCRIPEIIDLLQTRLCRNKNVALLHKLLPPFALTQIRNYL